MKYRVYNNTLNPALWNTDETIKPEVSQRLIQIARSFYEDVKLKPELKDVYLIGSSANYNWTPFSDVDIHIVINFADLKMGPEDAKNYTTALKSAWNLNHDIHIKKHNVELYIQDVNHKTHALGIYSILQNKWIVRPDKKVIKLDNELIQQKFSDLTQKIDTAIKSKNVDMIKVTLKDIYDMREAGLDNYGEFSTENIVFKLLRTKNYIDRLKDMINKIYDFQHSIKES